MEGKQKLYQNQTKLPSLLMTPTGKGLMGGIVISPRGRTGEAGFWKRKTKKLKIKTLNSKLSNNQCIIIFSSFTYQYRDEVA